MSTPEPEPLEAFFAQFASLGFGYRRSKTAYSNFKRLRQKAGWAEHSRELEAACHQYYIALVQQFNHVFGTSTDLEAWQKLCRFIDITPVPDTIKECRSRVWDAHVNIVDLLECARTEQRVRTFATLEQLREYTRSDKSRIIPKEIAYDEGGGLLKDLLREIINPYHGRRRNGSEKRKRRKARSQAAAAQLESS